MTTIPALTGSTVILPLNLTTAAADLTRAGAAGLANYVVVAVTRYVDDDDYFEIHDVAGAWSWLCPDNDCQFGSASKLYTQIARRLGIGDGWRAKAPSGSDWVTALMSHDAMDKPHTAH